MYTITNHSDELCHYGVLGMKWGVRRYQNYDGTRIGTGGEPVTNQAKKAGSSVALGQGGKAKGNARLAATAASPATKDKIKNLTEPSVKQGKGKDDISPAEKITRDTKKGIDASKSIVSVAEKHANKRSKEAASEQQMKKAKKMSDKELRDSINRIKMEREYTSLTTKDTESGWTKAREVLEVVGDVVEIAGAALGIYLMLKKAGIVHSDITFEDFQNAVDDDFIMHFTDMDNEAVEDYLEHHGVLGMKWGVRRYQNYDGTRIGAGSGSGGGGGGSSASKSFHGSVATGQGGKAVGNARLAANAIAIKPKYKNSQKEADRLVSQIDAKELSNLSDKASKAIELSKSLDVDALTKYENDYYSRSTDWALKVIKETDQRMYDEIINDAKNGRYTPTEHKYVDMMASEYDTVEKFNPPSADYDKAFDDYYDSVLDKGKKLSNGNEELRREITDSLLRKTGWI